MQQFFSYVSGVLQGDWGISLHTKQPVLDDLLRVIPATLVLVVAALLVAIALGVPLGIFAARSQGRFGDLVSKVIAIVSVSMPVFWLAILLQVVFSRGSAGCPSRVSTTLRSMSPARSPPSPTYRSSMPC